MNEKTGPERTRNLEPDERLACQARVVNPDVDVTVVIKEFGNYSILSESLETETTLQPAVARDGRVVRNVAGGFGNFINADNAVAIGLLPPAPEKQEANSPWDDKCRSNGAGS